MNTTDIIATYDNAAAEYARTRQGKEPKEELSNFMALLKPNSSVLDVGCAAGRDTRILKDRGFDVSGADLSAKLLELARKSNPDIPFILADMRNVPFKDGSFTAIWANAILHHLDESEMPVAIDEFKRLLQPGGILCVRTKMGQGNLKTRDEIVGDGEREFALLTSEKLDSLLTSKDFIKLELKISQSKSREGLLWLTATYRKSG